MPAKRKSDVPTELVQEWTLSAAATLGSSVRAKGIVLEVRAQLPMAVRKWVDVRGGVLALHKPLGSADDLGAVLDTISRTLSGIEALPVIPREIEDILSIKTSERHRWLKDGRLQSAGTRTVKLRGRAKKITFHVFDPRRVEDVLDRDLVSDWREQDAITAAENRRRAAAMRRLVRENKQVRAAPESGGGEGPTPQLQGWEAFELEGLLR